MSVSDVAAAPAPSIYTVAGDGAADFSGDGGPAVKAALNGPDGVALDSDGNVYIADTSNHRIRKVDAKTQTIATVAGNGTRDFTGDGGPAVDATFSSPRGLAVDADGNLYIADYYNNAVRRVDAKSHVVTTVAGTGGVTAFSGDGEPAVKAGLASPTAVAVDGDGNLYVADSSNQRIRRVDAKTQIITTVAGGYTNDFYGDGGPATHAAFDFPYDVAVDGDGNLYIADRYNNRVRRVDAKTQVISTVAGNGDYGSDGDGGPAVKASFGRPSGVAVDGDGNLYIADNSNQRIRRVDAKTQVISTVAGNGAQGFSGDDGPATSATLHDPAAVAVDGNGNVYIADTSNHRIRRVNGIPAPVPFSVEQGGPPDVALTHGGEIRYPGVKLHSEEDGTVTQIVRVDLPGRGLQFVAEGNPGYQLTVQGIGREPVHHIGTLSPDGQTLTFEDVELPLSVHGVTLAWVAVKALPDAPLGDAALNFRMGDRTSHSTPIHVVGRVTFLVEQGGPPDVTLTRSGEVRYPGVKLHSEGDGTVAGQSVRVHLPRARGLQFVAEGNSLYRLTVQAAGHEESASYVGMLSPDGQSLTFDNVNPALSGEGSTSRAWVAVRATSDAPLGVDALTFRVGDQTSPSTPVHVVDQ
ncbi:NHL repeat-containing protein [Streptomyces violascens]|uniref:NHL repeat-containing protein n=1 Tax=Streptomyces violascens TaxID=67381 RepID=UPI0036BDBA39